MEEIKTETVDVTPASDEGKTLNTNEPSHSKYSEKEKAERSLKFNANRVRELGGDPDEILGIKPALKIDETLSDDTPLTVKTLREFQRLEGKKTALQLANELPDDERDGVIDLLEKRLVPSGDAHADLALARSAVNAQRTSQVAEEMNRRTSPSRTASGGSASATSETPFEPTEHELFMMKLAPKLTKEKILEARRREQEKK